MHTTWSPLRSLSVDVRRVAQLGVGCPTFYNSSSLAHATLCQCLLYGLSVSSLDLLSLRLRARNSSCEVLESLAHCAQTARPELSLSELILYELILSELIRFCFVLGVRVSGSGLGFRVRV